MTVALFFCPLAPTAAFGQLRVINTEVTATSFYLTGARPPREDMTHTRAYHESHRCPDHAALDLSAVAKGLARFPSVNTGGYTK